MKKHLPKILGKDNFSEMLTESENMQANGWRKISDAGNIVFSKVL